MDNLKSLKKIAKGAFIVLIGIIISKLLTYIYRLLIARIGPEEYGLISLGFAIIGIMGIISLIGLEDGLTRYIAFYNAKKNHKNISRIFNFSLKLSTLLSIIFAILLFYYSKDISLNIFHNEQLIPILHFFSLSLPFYIIYKLSLAALRGLQNISAWSYIGNIGESAIKLIFTAILLYLGLGIIGATLAYVLTFFILAIISYVYLKKVHKISNLKSSFLLNKELLKYSWPLMLGTILMLLIGWIDTLLLGYFKNATEVGIYNAALPTSALLYIAPMALFSLFVPLLTELLTLKKDKEFKNIYITTTKWIFFVNLPLFSILFLFSKEILSILFGGSYTSGDTALQILAFGYLIYFIFDSSSKILSIIKKTKLILFNSFIALIITITLNIILIPLYGINGAAIATASSLIITGLLAFIETFYFMKIQPLNLSYIKPIIAIIISFFITTLIQNLYFKTGIIYLILYSIILITVYLLCIILLKGLSKEDIYILNLIKKFR